MDYSKYDSEGNVIYSESVGSVGERVRHFFSYDDKNRRICYKKISDIKNFSEYTTYLDNGNKIIELIIIDSVTRNIDTHKISTYNEYGRMIHEKNIHYTNSIITTSIYNVITDKYETLKTIHPFKMI